jgi:hypothetical protein
MAAEQNCCAETQCLLGGSSLKLAFRQAGAKCLVGDVTMEFFRPIVPAKFRKIFFLHLHSLSHPVRLASRRLVSSRFVWHNLANDTTIWAKSCLHCQRIKIHRHTSLLRSPSPFPSGSLLISTLTWWALYNTVLVATTFSRTLIAHPSG